MFVQFRDIIFVSKEHVLTCECADDAEHSGDSTDGVGEEEDGDGDDDDAGEEDALEALAEDGQVLVRVQEVVVEHARLHVLVAEPAENIK